MATRQQIQRLARERRLAALSGRERVMRARVHREALDRAKERTGSDQQTARVLDVPPQHLSDYRHGRRQPTPAAAIRLANLLNEPLFPAVARALAWTAHSKKTRRLWLDWAAGVWPERPRIFDEWAKRSATHQYPKR